MTVNRRLAQRLSRMVPDRVTATVALIPDTGSTVSVTVYQAWRKPLKTTAAMYQGVQLDGTEEIVNVLDSELNPSSEGRRIRNDDTITIGSEVLIVQAATLKSCRTRWECVVKEKFG